MFIHPHMASSDLVRELDAQLNRLGAVGTRIPPPWSQLVRVSLLPFRLTIQPSARLSRPI
jgi:hypothetical protein